MRESIEENVAQESISMDELRVEEGDEGLYETDLRIVPHSGDRVMLGAGEYATIALSVYGYGSEKAKEGHLPLVFRWNDRTIYPQSRVQVPYKTLAVPSYVLDNMDGDFPSVETVEVAGEKLTREICGR